MAVTQADIDEISAEIRKAITARSSGDSSVAYNIPEKRKERDRMQIEFNASKARGSRVKVGRYNPAYRS